MPRERKTAMLWGALVADAAAMGLHWLYDQERIAALAGTRPETGTRADSGAGQGAGRKLEFMDPDPAHYAGTKGYFAHPLKAAGDLSHYGEQLRAMLEGLADAHGRYDKQAYERAIVARFGYGGTFCGYIDKPTRATLDNLGRVDPEDPAAVAAFHGADDTQIPALAKLPALVAAHHGDPALDCLVESAVRVTNDNDLAVAFGRVAARMLDAALDGDDIEAVIAAGRSVATAPVAAVIDAALARRDDDNATVTRHFALHCQLTAAFPSLLHNLATAPDYTTAVRRNIMAGGDSCGRAIVLGAVLGAVHGIGKGRGGIPKAWINGLTERDDLAELVAAVLTSH